MAETRSAAAGPPGKSYCHQLPRNVSPAADVNGVFRNGMWFATFDRPSDPALYLQDAWTISDKFTLNVGTRFEKEDISQPSSGDPPPLGPPSFLTDYHLLDPGIFRFGSKTEW